MHLFNIPDIRLLWSQDTRFISQFTPNTITQFRPYSKYSPVYKDISFWLPNTSHKHRKPFHDNEFYELVRETGGDMVEGVDLIDTYVDPKTQRKSECYRITYRHMDRVITNAEVILQYIYIYIYRLM